MTSPAEHLEMRLALLHKLRTNPDFRDYAQRRFVKQLNRYFRPARRAQEYADFHNPDKSQGLLSGAIIAAKLGQPGPTTGELVYKQPSGNNWLGFDFIRPFVFMPLPTHQEHEGSLEGAPLDEVIGQSADERTPDKFFDPMNFMHSLTRRSFSMGDLAIMGMVRQTSYAEAYDGVGLYASYKEGLAQRRLTDEPVYQVTPKGNGLVFLLPPTDQADPVNAIDRHFISRQV